ncbi:MAG: N-6 DNA methylase [Thermomicrobiales bacterium]
MREDNEPNPILSDRPDAPIALVPAGRIRCYVHDGVLRPDRPEEHVRQRVARSLVEEYGYDRRDLHIEYSLKMGSRRKAADIVIFPHGVDHKQENVSVIVEAKREDVRPTDRHEGIEQLKTYMAACVNARWGLWVGSEMVAFEKEVDPARSAVTPFLEATDIPLRGATEPARLTFSELVPAQEGLRAVFKRCHDYIHTNGSLSKTQAFFELLKLIFCKIYDEQESSGVLEFSISQDERRSELGQRKLRQRINKLFSAVRLRYPYIFPATSESIELDNRSLAYCVGELQKYSLLRTPSDVKGEAYEEIVGVTSRRDQGAFFTPRNLCDLAVQMVLATYPPDRRLSLKILDPACGTGGFLRSALLEFRDIISSQEEAKWGTNSASAVNNASNRLRMVCDSNIFGIDKLAELVRAAQMNLALHGDGSSNVVAANSLLPPGEWPDDVRRKVNLGAFDAIFTNPPFGSNLPVDDPHILAQFELERFESKGLRSSMPPEQLFVERCLQFLRPGGRMAIVLPDSILSNPGLSFIRRWLLRNAYVIASVDLPREMFARSDTHTKTSVLILQKFSDEERRLVEATGRVPEYEIFMAMADRVGWDLRGNPVYFRTPEGEEVLQTVQRITPARDARGNAILVEREVEEPILDDHLPSIVAQFEQWLASRSPLAWSHAA